MSLFFFSACRTQYVLQSVQYKNYRINREVPVSDTTRFSFLNPYRDSLANIMNQIIGYADMTLEKQQPEGTLGNFMADAYLTMAKDKYQTHVDAAFMNYGGIRLTQLPAGPVTLGKIYELMPFDNVLILQKVKGEVLQQFLDLIASRGGWPVSGLTMQIQKEEPGKSDYKAVNVKIQGKPLNPDAEYIIANSDYIANGGDNAEMLRSIPQISNGYLMRDALVDYIKKLKSEGKNIRVTLENRVSYVK
ncbi:MAG: 5'-nucleotidase C-terminal domain-containing protein [Chitinophagaceae bacterium]|nr:5'-nucleotidase C-terminal domain-containing protein [Chitinophagaceae bacterium]